MGKAFEDLECWKLALTLDKAIYSLVKNSPVETDYALKNQMLRSVGSVADNIAEGFERGGNKEFIQFLFIAKGSCGELRSQLHRCKNREFIDEKIFESLYNECRTVSVKISNFITYLKNSELTGNKFKKINESSK